MHACMHVYSHEGDFDDWICPEYYMTMVSISGHIIKILIHCHEEEEEEEDNDSIADYQI